LTELLGQMHNKNQHDHLTSDKNHNRLVV